MLWNAAKLAVLREAENGAWADLASGRSDDVAENDLDDFISQLGHRSAAQMQSAG